MVPAFPLPSRVSLIYLPVYNAAQPYIVEMTESVWHLASFI